MEITSAQIKELRDQTGISVMQCKKALEEAGGDMEKAIVILKKRRSEAADKKSDRELGAGAVGAYIHNTNEVAALVVLACETDFVAKNPEFVTLAKEIAMQVAATSPKYLTKDAVSPESLEAAKAVFSAEVEGKPEEMKAKILEGKLASYFKDQILMEQPFIKNPDTTIGEMVNGAVQKFGENISIASFHRSSVK
jgi:elongation factor Ts